MQHIASTIPDFNATDDAHQQATHLRQAVVDSHVGTPELAISTYTAYDSFLVIHKIATLRTPSARNKMQKRKSAREVERADIHADENIRLTAESASTFKALAVNCNYLAQDRPDISFAIKEQCRDVSAPSVRSTVKLKRLIR